MRKLFIITVFILAFSIFAKAQGTTEYRFLEVIDSANKPVVDATVKVQISCDGGDKKTNEKGLVERFPIGGGDCGSLDDFTILKDGYFTFRDIGFFSSQYRNNTYLEQFFYNQYRNQDIYKIELLKIPKNKAEQKAIGKEQQKRELFWAVRDKNSVAVRKLLESGVNPYLKTSELRGVWLAPQNLSAIVYAAALGDIDTVKEFLKAGVELPKLDVPNRNILLYYLDANPWKSHEHSGTMSETEKANFARFQAGIDFLIKAKADINAATSDGKTALMLSAYNGDTQTVKTFLNKGSDVNQKDGFGQTALFYANNYNYESTPNKIETAEILLKQGANPNLLGKFNGGCVSPLTLAIANQNVSLAKLLLNYKADPNLTCEDGMTTIQIAIETERYNPTPQRYEMIKTLIKAGANASSVNKFGGTNLMFAVSRNEFNIAEMLLQNGANETVNHCNKNGETALIIARKLTDSTDNPMIRLLVKYGADPMKSINCLPY